MDKSVDEIQERVEKPFARQLSGRLIILVLTVKTRKRNGLREISTFRTTRCIPANNCEAVVHKDLARALERACLPSASDAQLTSTGRVRTANQTFIMSSFSADIAKPF